LALLRGLAAVLLLFFGMSAEECGERTAFYLISDRYSPGAWRISYLSDQVSANGVLEQYRERAGPEKVWDHTARVFDQALALGSTAA
jgi:hypothetical protein